jgi:hypothetical protein
MKILVPGHDHSTSVAMKKAAFFPVTSSKKVNDSFDAICSGAKEFHASPSMS